MSRVPFASPLLSGGISQQSPDVRLPNQVQDASNVDFTITHGLTRRVGTKHAAVVAGLTAALDYRMHAIERDGDERYLVIYGPGGVLKVYEILNDTFTPLLLEATVNISADATTYLTSGTPTGANLAAITVADYTIIANKTVVPTSTTSPNYSVTGIFDTYELMTATTPTNSTYHKLLSDSSGQIAGYYQFSSGTEVFATWTGPTRTSNATTNPAGDYDESANNPGGFYIEFTRLAMSYSACTTALVSGTTYTITKAGAFTSYTFVAGDMLYIVSGTGVTAGWATVVSRDSANQLTIKAHRNCVLAAFNDIVINGIGAEYDVQVNMDKDAGLVQPSMEAVAKKFQDGLRSAGCETGLVAWEKIGAGGRMVITAPYKGSDATVRSIAAPGAGLYDYTAAAKVFRFADGTANAGSGGTASTTKSVETRWTRVAAPAQTSARLVSTTMPIKLVRTTVGDHSATPAVFTCGVITWNDRLSGDDTTNPVLPIVSKGLGIQDILFHQDRFILSGGEYVCFSQTGDLFNFYNDNTANIVDSDPITFPLSVSSVVSVQHLVPFRKNILAFTFAGPHFELSADGPFKPSNVVSTAATSHATWPVRPAQMDGRVYYVSERGSFASVFEYFYDDLTVNNQANDVASHVPVLVPLNIKTIQTVRLENAVIVLPMDTSFDHQLFVYRSAWLGNRKDQSAWTVYTFDTGYRIVDIATIRNRVYMLVETSAGYHIEYFSYELDSFTALDKTNEYIKHLDCQHQLIGVYAAGVTTWTLPQSDTTINTAIPLSTPGGSSIAVFETPITIVSTGTTATATGRYDACTCIVGRKYTSSAEISTFYPRDSNGIASIQVGATVSNVTFHHRRTGVYNSRLDFGRADPRSTPSTDYPTGFSVETYTPPKANINDPQPVISPSGVFKPWIVFNAESSRLFVESSSCYPMNITGINATLTITNQLR